MESEKLILKPSYTAVFKTVLKSYLSSCNRCDFTRFFAIVQIFDKVVIFIRNVSCDQRKFEYSSLISQGSNHRSLLLVTSHIRSALCTLCNERQIEIIMTTHCSTGRFNSCTCRLLCKGANSITPPRLTLPQAYSENNGLEKKNEILKMRFEIVFADVSKIHIF